MSTNDGIYLEKIVALLEQSLDPEATIKHDVDMPILTSKEGHTAQCDVVIWSGQKPREIITICEVQDRHNKAMPPQDVRGFKQKGEEVGAQRVICISRKQFSASNKERAAQSGGSIVLMTISDWDIDSLPFDFINVEPSYREFCLTEINSLALTFSKDELLQSEAEKLNIVPFKALDEIFSYDKINLISITSLCRSMSKSINSSFEGESTLDLASDRDPQLFIFANEKFYKIGLKFNFKYKWEVTALKPYMLSYEQDSHGILAWYLEASHELECGLVSMKIPIVKDGEKFLIYPIDVEIPEGASFNLSILKGDT